jgi:hypothetical protein
MKIALTSIHSLFLSNHKQPNPDSTNRVFDAAFSSFGNGIGSAQKIIAPISRYCGSKSWSIPGVIAKSLSHFFSGCEKKGSTEPLLVNEYKFQFERRLTQQEVLDNLPLASLAVASHCSQDKYSKDLGFNLVSPLDLNRKDPSFDAYESCYFNEKTGVKIVIFEKENEIVIGFGAKDSLPGPINDEERIKEIKSHQVSVIKNNLIGLNEEAYGQTQAFIEKLLGDRRFDKKKITLVGSCFGGSFAQYIGLKLKIRAVCFNSLQMGAGLQAEIGEKNIQEAKFFVKHIGVEKDFLNDSRLLKSLDLFVSSLGLKTPGNFGESFSVPSAYTTSKGTHSYFLGSMMKYIGYDERTLPGDIKDVIEKGEIPKGS